MRCISTTFQFTPLREGRQYVTRDELNTLTNFNSRPSARGDSRKRLPCDCKRISIHAPPRGATANGGIPTPLVTISIHAPPRGATGGYEGRKREGIIFQFTPLREGRRGRICQITARVLTFQFTPLREGRPREIIAKRKAERNFNSRPSARGDARGSTRS